MLSDAERIVSSVEIPISEGGMAVAVTNTSGGFWFLPASGSAYRVMALTESVSVRVVKISLSVVTT